MPYVSLDLETTGLDPEADEIIEVAAIRFDADGVIERYHSLVNPERALEFRIALLTNIDGKDLASAPHFTAIAREVEDFIGMDPIVGQNPTFDTTFLERNGVAVFGPTYDTHELANLLLPGLRQRSSAPSPTISGSSSRTATAPWPMPRPRCPSSPPSASASPTPLPRFWPRPTAWHRRATGPSATSSARSRPNTPPPRRR